MKLQTVRFECSPTTASVIHRQLPRRTQGWGDFSFDFSGAVRNPDFLVVLEDVAHPVRCECSRERTVLLCSEPSAVGSYHPRLTRRFGAVVSCQRRVAHRNLFLRNPCLSWWAGIEMLSPSDWRVRFDYEDFLVMEFPGKIDKISVVNSGKSLINGHTVRNDFLARIKRHFGDRLDIFGHGSRPIRDKLEAILPYKYHIAIENSVEPHYWSEKLGDAYLGGAMPIYCGCPNLEEYFSPESFCRIDIRDPSTAIPTIEDALSRDTFQRTSLARKISRDHILQKYNIFAVLSELLPKLHLGQQRRVSIYPHRHVSFPAIGRVARNLRSVISGGVKHAR